MTRVVIVGGGIVGCAAAYFCTREDMDVTLVESERIAYGASGRNPGFVWLHCRNPGFGLQVSLAGRALYDELLTELPPFGFRSNGGLIYFTQPEQAAAFGEFAAARREHGLPIELIDGAAVRKLVPPIRPDVLGASFCPLDAQITTPLLVQRLAQASAEQGATILEHTRVRGVIESGGDVCGVTIDTGSIEADVVVLAAGVWTRALAATAGVDLPIGGERLQVMATHPLPMQVQPLVYGPLATKQYSLFRDLPSWRREDFTVAYESEQGIEMLQLLAQRPTGEILLGCPMDYPAEIDDRPTLDGVAAITEMIGQDFPGLRSAPIDRVWAGVLPYTADLAPVIDEVVPGLVVAAGHVFGNAAGPVTGRIVSQLIRGAEPQIDISECRFDRALEQVGGGAPTRW